jgi:GNAT superfamily N-acetyltransferase
MNDHAVRIRPATAGDTRTLAALCGELGYPATPGDAARRFAALAGDPLHAVFVSEKPAADAVTGFVHVYEHRLLVAEPFAELGGLVVSAPERRGGTGAALLAAACGWARERGLAELRVRSGTARDAAHDFYPAAGCRRIKSQHVYAIDLRAGGGA